MAVLRGAFSKAIFMIAFFLVILVFALLIFLGILDFIKEETVKLEETALSTQEGSVEKLFHSMRRLEFIRFNGRSGKLELPPEDIQLVQRLNKKLDRPPESGADWPELKTEFQRSVLNRLYSTRDGVTIRREVAAWNAENMIVAIRDNRQPIPLNSDEPTEESEEIRSDLEPVALTRRGGKKLNWTAFAYKDSEPERVFDVTSSKGVPNTEYSHFALESPGILNDWMRASNPSAEFDRVRFETTLEGIEGGSELVINVIGGAPQLSTGEASFKFFCPKPEDIGSTVSRECKEGEKSTSARVSVRIPSPRPEKLTLTVVPTRYLSKEARDILARGQDVEYRLPPCALKGLKDANFKPCDPATDFLGWKKVGITDSLRIFCNLKAKTIPCALAWEKPKERLHEGRKKNSVVIRTADRTVLSDTKLKGWVTKEALDLGLLPLVGVGVEDFASLGYSMSNAGEDFVIDLTLRADYQKITLRSLRKALDRQILSDRVIQPKYDGVREAAVVLIGIDGAPRLSSAPSGRSLGRGTKNGSSRGDILAAASLPGLRGKEHVWNVLAGIQASPSRSGLTNRPWTAHTNEHYAPGSVQKAVTALAMIRQYVEQQDPSLEKALSGASGGEKNFGFNLPDGVVIDSDKEGKEAIHVPGGSGKVVAIHNSGDVPSSRGLLSPLVTGCPRAPNSSSEEEGQLGLCEALMKSLNIWFIAGGLSVDGKDVPVEAQVGGDRDDLPDQVEFQIGKVEANLAGGDEQSLIAVKGKGVRAGNRAWAFGSSSGFFNRPTTPLLSLAQKAFGQDMQATPLWIAKIYGSIGSGCKIRPSLTSRGKVGCDPLLFTDNAEAENQARDLVERYLVPGLYAVVNKDGGTARKAFKPFKLFPQAVYGKTGTANTTLGGNVYTTWFAGWIDHKILVRLGVGPGLVDQDVAFACMISHAKGTGGGVCAKVIADILNELVQTSAHEDDE